MATPIRVATFNCENLFARFQFKKKVNVSTVSKDGWDINATVFQVNHPDARKLTGKAIQEANADVVALQEVENLDVLKRFRNKYLGGFKAYPHAVLIEGNDPRLIDVAVLSRQQFPLTHVRTYHHLKATPSSHGFIFSRDCLEVDVQVGTQTLSLYVNHLKSMLGGRAQTRPRRQAQVQTVKSLITARFGPNPGDSPFIVLGDLNDYLLSPNDPTSGIPLIVEWDQVENVVLRLPAGDQWSHFWNKGNEYRQLDYLLVSKSLKSGVRSVEIVRNGLPKRATRYAGPRFKGVGDNEPKASDHCPVVVELTV